MSKAWIAAALLPLLAAWAVAQEPGAGPEAKASFEKRSYPFEGEVAADRLNVRMFPKNDQTGIITSVLSLGEKVTVVSETGDYYQILPPKGSTAWVVSRNVKREGEAGTVLGSDVPVRLDSRVNADQVATLKQGEAVRIVGENMGWFKIEAPVAVKYFVGKKFVRPGKALDASVLGSLASKDEPKKAATSGKTDGDAKARALLAMADEELKAQVKLLDERRVTEFDLTRTVDLFENAKTEAASPAVRSEADRGLAHAGTVHKLWATTKEEIKKKEAELAAAKAAVAAEKVVEESRPTMAGHIDTTGLLWKRPGTHKLVMGGKTVCFLRVKEGDDKMISRLNDHYQRYVGVKGTVIKNPEGWDGYSVVVVEEIIPLTNPQ